MVNFDGSPQIPDFKAINEAHRQAELLGVVSPNSRPIGSVPLDRAFAECVEVDPIDISALGGPRKPGNGFGGSGKTFRRNPVGGTSSGSSHPVLEALAEHDEFVAREADEAARGIEYEIDEYGNEWVVRQYSLSDEQLEERRQKILEKGEAKKPKVIVNSLREQPYAKAIATRPSKAELDAAAAKLAADSARYGRGRNKLKRSNGW